MVPWTLLGIGICGGMFILHNHLRTQAQHSWLLVIGKADIMVEVNKYQLMLYYPSLLFLRLWIYVGGFAGQREM